MMMMTVMIIRWSNEARQSARAGLAAPSLSAGPQVAVLIIIIIIMIGIMMVRMTIIILVVLMGWDETDVK